jgi:hypothetical protein
MVTFDHWTEANAETEWLLPSLSYVVVFNHHISHQALACFRIKHIITSFIIIFQLKEISHVCNEHLWFMKQHVFSNVIYLV